MRNQIEEINLCCGPLEIKEFGSVILILCQDHQLYLADIDQATVQKFVPKSLHLPVLSNTGLGEYIETEFGEFKYYLIEAEGRRFLSRIHVSVPKDKESAYLSQNTMEIQDVY